MMKRTMAAAGLAAGLAGSIGVGSAGAAPPPRPSTNASTTYHYAMIDGVRVFYREAGPKDAPTILLLHGFPASSRQFATLIPLLAERYHIVAPDYPGFGLSDAPASDRFVYSFDHLTKVIDDLTESLGLKHYVLFMNDYGGPVGFRLALAHSDRVLAMIVQNAVAHEAGLTPAWAARKAFWNDRSAHEAQVIAGFMDPESFRKRHIGSSPRPDRYDPTSWRDERAQLSRPGQEKVQADLSYDYRTNVAAYPQWQAWLSEHQPPLLVVWGKYDPVFAVAGATAFLHDVPEAEVHILNAGHFATEEAVDQIAELTHRFLAQQIGYDGEKRVPAK